MLQLMSKIYINDNSGAKIARIIQTKGKPNKGIAYIGDYVKASVREVNKLTKTTMKKGTMSYFLLVTSKQYENRLDGSYSKFDQNTSITLNAEMHPSATRLLGPSSDKLRKKVHERAAALIPTII